jgi:hypothetical protein
MKFRIAVAGIWSVSWALLGCWLFDPESHLTRGPTFFVDNRVAESTWTAVALGALCGGLGGVVALTAARSRSWWVAVDSRVALPGVRPTGAAAAATPCGGAAFALFGAVVGVPAGLLLLIVAEVANRHGGESRAVS